MQQEYFYSFSIRLSEAVEVSDLSKGIDVVLP